MSLFALGVIDPLLVERFSGFDIPSFVSRVRLLGDDTYGPHEVIQGSGVPFPTANITGTLTESGDCTLLREYNLTKQAVTFVDGRGTSYPVRVIDLAIEDMTDWWTFSATLIDTSTIVTPGS